MLEERAAHIQEAEITVLMKDFLDTPENFYKHVRRVTASIANILIFGQRGATFEGSFWGHGVYDALDRFGEALEPGANPPVDEYPFLQYMPAYFSAWKQRALSAGRAMDKIWNSALTAVETRRALGDVRPCIADRLLDEYAEKGNPFNRHAFFMLLGEMCEGGAETTSSSMLTMILAITKYPEVQRKARVQIDAVCGTERSPLWSDFNEMPYVNAIVKEGMRWRPVISSGLPHQNKEDDYYEGMFIPKGSTIFIPIWALNNLESNGFVSPETYNPDRYINHPRLANDYAGSPDYNERDHYGYGTGRRMCPGIHLAERNQWRIVAKLLWAFEFEEPVGEDGKKVVLDEESYAKGLLHSPLPFKCVIRPRSEKHIEVIRREAKKALEELKVWE
jgi:cytochrome P450